VNKIAYVLCLLAVLALGVGCGGSDSTGAGDGQTGSEEQSTASAAEEPPTENKKPKVTVVFRAESENLGHILFDEEGVTLYRFTKDKGPKSTCYGACAKSWPPYLTEGKLKARAVIPSELGFTKRKDGNLQVTYFDHPLYYFSGDTGGAQYNGQGAKAFGGTWYAMHPDGEDAGG